MSVLKKKDREFTVITLPTDAKTKTKYMEFFSVGKALYNNKPHLHYHILTCYSIAEASKET